MNSRRQTFVIAEAGVNHNGSVELALELVSAARRSGADAIKFQTFNAERLASRHAAKASYQKRLTSGDDSQYGMLKALELGPDDFHAIVDQCRHEGIEFLSSPFDEPAADLLNSLGVRRFKIASGEMTNLPLLRHLAATGKELIVSTGMSWLGEVETAVRTLESAGAGHTTLLHCVTDYPAPVDQVNLAAMTTLSQAFGLPVGYSDHTTGIEIAVAAVALGATVVEKHFTLDVNMLGPDHAASLDPAAFTRMVAAIRNTERALGDGRKRPAPCELANRDVVRKSVVAARDLAAGTRLTAQDLAIKRPGTGLAPSMLPDLLGRKTTRAVARDDLIRREDVQ